MMPFMTGSVGGTEQSAFSEGESSRVDALGNRSFGEEAFSEIIVRAQTGDSSAIADLYRLHVGIVLGYLRANGCPNPDDATADVFLGMMQSIDRFTGSENEFRRWLMTIAHRRLIDNRRRKRRMGVEESLPGSLSNVHFLSGRSSPFPDPMVRDHELVRAIATLTGDQRQVIGLRYIADLPLDEVAAITGRSVGSVKALQRRGLNALRRALGVTNSKPRTRGVKR